LEAFCLPGTRFFARVFHPGFSNQKVKRLRNGLHKRGQGETLQKGDKNDIYQNNSMGLTARGGILEELPQKPAVGRSPRSDIELNFLS
jgi:hypothetical protein